MQKYNKLIVAVVGLLAVLMGPDFLELGESDQIAQTVLAVLTAFGVYQVRNIDNG